MLVRQDLLLRARERTFEHRQRLTSSAGRCLALPSAGFGNLESAIGLREQRNRILMVKVRENCQDEKT